jgi:hypothetical protein
MSGSGPVAFRALPGQTRVPSERTRAGSHPCEQGGSEGKKRISGKLEQIVSFPPGCAKPL